jgi:hypothetical protein
MQNRLAKFASALVVGLVAATGFAIASDDNAARKTECLAGPKGTPPEGSHWFYGVDRANNRRCWFLGDAQQRRAPVKRERVAEKPVPSNSKPELSRQVADARAELQASRAEAEPPTFRTRVATAAPPPIDTSGPADALVAAARWALAQRWPDRAEDDGATGSEPTVVEVNVDLPSNATSEIASAPASATPVLPTGKMSGVASSVQMLMIVLAASLALAGLIATAILKLASIRRAAYSTQQPMIWDALNNHRSPLRKQAGTSALEMDTKPSPTQPIASEHASKPVPAWLMISRPR